MNTWPEQKITFFTLSAATRFLLVSVITLLNLRFSLKSSMSELAALCLRSFFGATTISGFLKGLLNYLLSTWKYYAADVQLTTCILTLCILKLFGSSSKGTLSSSSHNCRNLSTLQDECSGPYPS
jgi:hypothetical protein